MPNLVRAIIFVSSSLVIERRSNAPRYNSRISPPAKIPSGHRRSNKTPALPHLNLLYSYQPRPKRCFASLSLVPLCTLRTPSPQPFPPLSTTVSSPPPANVDPTPSSQRPPLPAHRLHLILLLQTLLPLPSLDARKTYPPVDPSRRYRSDLTPPVEDS